MHNSPLPYILMIGGGSINWTPKLLLDFALHPLLKGGRVKLYDIDREAAERNAAIGRKIYELVGAEGEVGTVDNLDEGLEGADFVLLTIAVGMLDAMSRDIEIPKKYGFIQTVGDTVGPGGWIRGQRHFPFIAELASKMKIICPDAWLLNLTNPMTLITRYACLQEIKCIGLCHEVDNALPALAGHLQVKEEEIRLRVAGINHLPWIVDAVISGEEGYGILKKKLNHDKILAEFEIIDYEYMNPFDDFFVAKARMLAEFGWLPFAGDRHIVEFAPYCLKEKYRDGRDWGVKPTTMDNRRRVQQFMYALGESVLAGDSSVPLERSKEAASDVISCLWFGEKGEFVLNVPNKGQISNLPLEVVVECNAIVERDRYTPLSTGNLPAVVQGMIYPHVICQEMLVESALERNREKAIHSLLLDPVITDLDAGRLMAKELLAENEKWLAKAR